MRVGWRLTKARHAAIPFEVVEWSEQLRPVSSVWLGAVRRSVQVRLCTSRCMSEKMFGVIIIITIIIIIYLSATRRFAPSVYQNNTTQQDIGQIWQDVSGHSALHQLELMKLHYYYYYYYHYYYDKKRLHAVYKLQKDVCHNL